MAPRKTQVVNQLQSDAAEFGQAVRCGGWRLGLLVARNVEPGTGGPRPAEPRTGAQLEKVSGHQFAELAGVSARTVDYYYKAWQLAAKAKLVPDAKTIQPGDEDVCIDIDAIEDEDNPQTQWSWFYSLAKNPPPAAKAKEKQKDSKPEPELPKQTTTEASDDVDGDFGIATKAEVQEADSDIQRNQLLEVLESLRSIQSRVEQAGASKGEGPDSVLSQIGDLAMNLFTTASALKTSSKESENV
jgi:hypothetical protein